VSGWTLLAGSVAIVVVAVIAGTVGRRWLARRQVTVAVLARLILFAIVLVIGLSLILYGFENANTPGSRPSISVPTTTPGSSIPPATTTPVPPIFTYDIDHDGGIDFVSAGNQLVAVPAVPDNNGPYYLAVITGVFLVISTVGAAVVTARWTRPGPSGQT
jgi:hypothetical protein